MQTSQLLKAGVTGLIGSLAMFILIQIALTSGMAPFNVPPSAAMLIKLGLPAKPLALIVHFLYGAFWSIVLVWIYKENTGVKQGLLVSFILWLIMMLVMSPIIGWGFFGFGGNEFAPDHKLHLAAGPKYPIATLIIHVVYGIVIGGVNKAWSIKNQQETSSAI